MNDWATTTALKLSSGNYTRTVKTDLFSLSEPVHLSSGDMMLLKHSKSDWLLPLLGWGVTFTILSILSLVCNHKTARLPVCLNAQHARTHFEEQQRDMVQVKELKDKTVIVPLKVLIKMSCCHGDETSEGGGGVDF